MTRYSQNDEQDFILKFFGDFTGNLLEIGAFDGITFSNTRALLERGWFGDLVEPDPRNVVKLMENCAGLSVEILPVAVGVEFTWGRLSMDATLDRGWSSTITSRCLPGVLKPLPIKLTVPVVAVSHLFSPQTFEFISIDAEGMDFDILRAIPSDALKACRLLCIEPHNLAEREEMRAWLLAAGFKTAHETPENLIVCQK